MSRKVNRPLLGRQVCLNREGAGAQGRAERDRDHESPHPPAPHPAVRRLRESQANVPHSRTNHRWRALRASDRRELHSD